MKRLILFLLLIPLFAVAQTDLLPVVAWRTYATNVEMVTDSTYKFDVMPLDWNEPGAAVIDYGNYFQDYAGNKYQVIDSAYLSVTVWDVFETGVSPQVGRIGVMYQSPDGGDAPYLAPINYQYLDETALDNARAIELAVLWDEANQYATDSATIQYWNDTISVDGTKYDIDTLQSRLLDSIFDHRTEINELQDSSAIYSALLDSLQLIVPATSIEAQTGIDNTNYITPLTINEQIKLNAVPYFGGKEDLYFTGQKIVTDSVIVGAIRSWADSLMIYGKVHVTDTLVVEKLRLQGAYTTGYYLKVNSNGNIIAESISGALVYQGTWNAETNTPTLVDGTGTNGYYYRVTVGDTIDLGSGDIIFLRGDDVMYNGTMWQRIPGLGFVLEAATASDLGGVIIGDNIDVETDGTISITRQTLTAGETAGSLTISEGNTVTINVKDGDYSITNEIQSVTFNTSTGALTISGGGTGTSIDGRYVLITVFNDSLATIRNEIDSIFARIQVHSDTLKQLLSWNTAQSDSLSLLADSLASYTLLSTFNDSIGVHLDTLQAHNVRINNLVYLVDTLTSSVYDSLGVHRDILDNHTDSIAAHLIRLDDAVDSLAQHRTELDNNADSLAAHLVRLDNLNDSIAAHFLRLNNIDDSLAVYLDTLQAHNQRLIVLESLDIAEISDLTGIRDSLSAAYDSLAVHLDTLQSHNNRINALINTIDTLSGSVYDSLAGHFIRLTNLEDSLTNIYTESQINTFLAGKADTTQINSILDSLANIYTESEVNILLGTKADTITTNNLRDSLSFYTLTTVINDSLEAHLDNILNNQSRIIAIEDSLTNIYTESQVNTLLGAKADTVQIISILDSLANIYTENQVDVLLGAKADTTSINSILDSLSNIYTDEQVNTLLGAKADTITTNVLFDSLAYYLLITDFDDTLFVLRSEIPTLLTQLDSVGFKITESQISDLQAYLLESDLSGIRDTMQFHTDSLIVAYDSLGVLAGLISDLDSLNDIATAVQAQTGTSDLLMSVLRVAEQIALNAVPYYAVREDIYSNYDATFDSIFAINHYQFISNEIPTGTINGTNTVFTTANTFAAGSTEVYLNGILQRPTSDYTEGSGTITFVKAPRTGDGILIKYKYQ